MHEYESQKNVNIKSDSEEVKLNVFTKEEGERKIAPVLSAIADVIAKSLGRYGSPTIISIYPYTYSTKDGFTIMKYIEPENMFDRIVYTMAFTICERLNNLVGDGTTTSIVSANEIYKSYLERRNDIKNMMISSKEIMDAFDKLKVEIISTLKKKSIKINSMEIDEMSEYIRKVVAISSNDDKEVTDNIVGLYKQLGFPAINLSLSSDGKTHTNVIDGFQADISLNDEIYANNDNKTAYHRDVDIIIFDHKISISTYDNIIVKLSASCKARKRKLIVIAPFYDEIAIKQRISNDLMKEYEREKSINTILMTCSSISNYDKYTLDDLSMLLNTSIITRDMEEHIIEKAAEGFSVDALVNIDKRNLDDRTLVAVMTNPEKGDASLRRYGDLTDNDRANLYGLDEKHVILNLGHCSEAELSLKKSIFRGFRYNESLYQAHINDAKNKLQDAENKYKEMGTFNFEITNAQNRLHALRLKIGSIEVGADVELKQNFLKDVYDDAVKGAASAYDNGVILGCNVSLSQSINKVAERYGEGTVERLVCEILSVGFKRVYARVIENMLGEDRKEAKVTDDIVKFLKLGASFDADDTTLLTDYIINRSIEESVVFDLGEKEFTCNIINSLDTDVQVLNATIGLLSMLIAGNQFVCMHVNK